MNRAAVGSSEKPARPEAESREERLEKIGQIQEELVEFTQLFNEARRIGGHGPAELEVLREKRDEVRQDLVWAEQDLARLDGGLMLAHSERMAAAAESSAHASAAASRWAKWAAISGAVAAVGTLGAALLR
jgi:chromosome segregation ATPase